jgi:arabinofuranosyltransferase
MPGESPTALGSRAARRAVIAAFGLGLAALMVLLLRTAWVSEDAYITFRVTDNFLHGYGLRWNVDERVQTFTHPLFFFVVTLATWISGNVYLSAVVVSAAASLAAVVLILRDASALGGCLALIALILSKGFVDYSICGLENPLTHLALAAYLFAYWRKRGSFQLTMLAALAAINRLDSVLFFLPSLAGIYLEEVRQFGRRRTLLRALAGWSPLLAWLSFSLFYYGFLFPNTAYAKLNTGIPERELIAQGFKYLGYGFGWDTASMLTIVIGLVVAFLARERLLAAGILLNLAYVVSVGGDFMAGRFLTPALFASAALLAHLWPSRPAFRAAAAVALLVAAALSTPRPSIYSAKRDYTAPRAEDQQIQDERGFYFQCTGLLHYRSGTIFPNCDWALRGDRWRHDDRPPVRIDGNVGLVGYFSGPRIHLIDFNALCDPLLARLPTVNETWRIGHFRREIPVGYKETLATGTNQFVYDQSLGEYYQHLHTVISGPLWSLGRLKEIFLFNIGHYNSLIPASYKSLGQH